MNLIDGIRCYNEVGGLQRSMAVGWAVFRNYVGHAKEIYGDITEYPLFFLMPPSALVEADREGNNVVALSSATEHIDHEVELVIKLGDDLQPIEMCVGCDTTNRTRQTRAKKEGWPWLEGKGFTGSGVLGTWTKWDPNILSVGLSINGELRQESTTNLMVHSVDSILSHLNSWYTPSPGDLIWTGTPQGVGPMKEGDVIECWLKDTKGNVISTLSATCVI